MLSVASPMITPSPITPRPKRRREREAPVLLQVTMLLVKLVLGSMAAVLAVVVLMNYRVVNR